MTLLFRLAADAAMVVGPVAGIVVAAALVKLWLGEAGATDDGAGLSVPMIRLARPTVLLLAAAVVVRLAWVAHLPASR